MKPPRLTKRRRDYMVGYGKPPAQSQFRKGKSGNPSGRPKGAKTKMHAPGTALDGLVLAEAYRPITIRENDQQIEMPLIQASLRSLGVGAVKGNHRSQALLAAMVDVAQEREHRLKIDLFEALANFKLDWEKEFRAYDRAGQPRPDIVPHPDDLQIDTIQAQVRINGPFDEVEKAKWDKAAKERARWKEDLDWATKAKRRKNASQEFFDAEIAHARRIIDLINLSYPAEEIRREVGFDLRAWRQRRVDGTRLRSPQNAEKQS